MNEEAYFRSELKKFRHVATLLQRVVMGEAIYREASVLQTTVIVEGIGYWFPSYLLVRMLSITGELELKDEVCPDCGCIITREEQKKQEMARAEKLLRKMFDPVEITHKVTLPLVKIWLESIERTMVEEGYRLPKWERPEWLLDLERKKMSESRDSK